MTDLYDIRNHTTRRRSDSPSSSGEEQRADVEQNPLSYTRSSSPTAAGRNSSESQHTVEPTPNTSDGKTQKTDAALRGSDKGATRKHKNRVEDPRKDVRVIRVRDFHLFYWLAATPTTITNKDRSPAAGGEEQDRREVISFNLDNRALRQCIAQMQTYLKKKNKISHRAYVQCPSKRLDELDAWAATLSQGKRGILQKVRQEIQNLNKVECDDRGAKRKEDRRAEESAQPWEERLMRKIEVLEREEERRFAKQKLDELGVREFSNKENEANLEPGIESETEEKWFSPYSPERHESQGKAKSCGKGSSSSAGSSPRIPKYEQDPATGLFKKITKPKTILKLSKQLFAFFFPLTYSSNMTDRYWGGVFRLLLHVGIVASWALPHADTLY